MTFRVGQKVACIRAFSSEHDFRGMIEFPQASKVYVIREIVDGHDGYTIRPGLLLEEIHNDVGPWGVEYNFDPVRFRPIVSRKTDISCFIEILNHSEREIVA